MDAGTQQPFILPDEQVQRVHQIVCQILPPQYDREFIADTIILHAWMNGLDMISKQYIRHKCISAWRQHKREKRRNEEAGHIMRIRHRKSEISEDSEEHIDLKLMVDDIVQRCLSPFERRLVWMKYYDSQTLDEMSEGVRMSIKDIQRALQVALYKMRMELT